MTVKKLKNVMMHMSCVLILTVAANGCIKDKTADCEDIYTLTVRAYDVSGAQLTNEDVRDVTLFIFDGDDRFVRKVETQIDQNVPIKAPSGEEVLIVAWGNLSEGVQTCADPSPGDLLEDCMVELSALTRSASDVKSPGDLFRGRIALTSEDKSGEVILPIYREVGGMTVTVRGLKTFGGFDDDDYSIVVRDTYSTIGFDGVLAGGRATYYPQGSFAPNGDYVVAPFNLLPENGLYIDIYHGTQLITTISIDSDGVQLCVEKGKLTNVLIDLKVLLSVSITIGNWGDVKVWKEF